MKCYFCKKEIPKGEGYQWVHESSTGKQYRRTCCSLEEKEQIERDKELYKQIQYETDAILGRPITNNARNKEVQELHEQYSYEQILRCIRAKANDIKELLEYNDIKNDYQQIRYMMQVIKNCIYDFVEEDKRINDFSQYVKQSENVDISFEETEEDILNRLKNKKDNSNAITDFLNGLKKE